MKKKLLFLMLVAALISCTKEEDVNNSSQDIWLKGYTALQPSSSYETATVKFLFFSANNGETYKTEAKSFDGSIAEYQELHDETFDLLQNGKMMLTNGNTVDAVATKYAMKTSSTYETLTVPVGKYFVVAIYADSKNGYLWLYSTKYTGMYYDVKSAYNPPSISVVFPCDRNRYGHIKWTQWHEKFDYEFTF
jgi:hypothetical protein